MEPATNVDEKCSIAMDENSVLVFSFVGYKTKEISEENRTNLNVNMSLDILTLSELVGLAMARLRKKM